ncbi:MAG: 1-acyl-sn-glycerol-3-phosphate acyltransferase [Deltaproteobacteria bacterium]|nr:1-acyl-sn-glycerol-3-phosphate acyltransferase [Deltaproteobacteria bacterium]
MMNRILPIIFLIFFGTSSAFLFVIAFIIWLFTVMFDRRLVLLHMFTSFWGHLYVWVMPIWSVSIKGRHKLKKRTTYMIVSNHQSQLDILVAFGLFFPFKWVSKAEVFKLPFIGWNMTLNRYIKLKRGDRKSIHKMMVECEKMISKGNSLYFFPESTRSKTGIMRPFKPGAFILAKKMKTPILPIAINGTKNALPKHSIFFKGSHKIRFEVLDEIPYEDFRDLSVEELAANVREKIAAHVDEHTET